MNKKQIDEYKPTIFLRRLQRMTNKELTLLLDEANLPLLDVIIDETSKVSRAL